MGIPLFKTVVVSFLLICVPILSFSQTVPEIQLEKTVALRELFGRSYDENVLKLFDAAVDESRNEIYVSGIMSAHVAVLDGTEDSILRTKDTGITSFQIKFLQCDETSRSLYVYNFSEGELSRFSLDDEETASATIEVDTGMNILNDPDRNLLYRTSPVFPFLFFHDPITLETLVIDCPASSSMGEGAGPMILDESAHLLYILDIARGDGIARIYAINTVDYTMADTVTLNIPPSQNPSNFGRDADGNFYVVTERSLFSLSASGAVIAKKDLPADLQFESFVFYPEKQESYLLFCDVPSGGLVEGIGNTLYKYGGTRLIEGGSVSFGRKAHRMTLNPLTGRLYIPNADAATLWIVETGTMTLSSIRIGDSVEQIVAGSGGSPVYMNSRLGGSYMVSYDPDTGTAEEFTAGTWPIPMEISDDGSRLYVCNAWEGTLSIFQTAPERSLLGTIDLTVPPGSTDRLPDLAIDDAHKFAYVAYPEHHQIDMVNLSTFSSLGTLDISSLSYEKTDGGGQGEVRLCVVESHNRLFAFSFFKRTLSVYETSAAGATLIDTLSFDTPDMKWQRMNDATSLRWFFYDAIEDQLFLGPFVLNPSTGEWTGETLPDLYRVFYRDDERGLYWGNGLDTVDGVQYNVLYLIDMESRTTVHSMYLREADAAKPDYYFDPVRNRLYVGYMMAAEFDVYEVSESEEPELPSTGTIFTYVNSEGIGKIAVRLTLPDFLRYEEGAPILVEIRIFFTQTNGFVNEVPANELGIVNVSYLWPGESDRSTGVSSEGVFDYGGPDSLAALRDVLRFVTGSIPDSEGKYIHELMSIVPLTDNVGLYAFSHPGIAATNVMALYGSELPNIKYLVGRENPTEDKLSCVEVGHWGDDGRPVLNPFYHYPADYSATALNIDYSRVGWIQDATYPDGRPYFEAPSGSRYVLGERVPSMWGKRYYSIAMTQALFDNSVFDASGWPADLATVEETLEHWPFRSTTANYPALATQAPDLKVMLVFAKNDHVQPALDKPHIHQAYDGFHGEAGFWVRLNPDRAYVAAIDPAASVAFPDNDPNTEPDWRDPLAWSHPNTAGSSIKAAMAAVCEMADRVRYGKWDDENLDDVLSDDTVPEPMAGTIAVDLPSLSTGSAEGTLALNVKFPERARYAEGAPVVVFALGGTTAGSLSNTLLAYAEDTIVISFLYPGGRMGDRSSGGVYDYRGPNCILALRDVLLYAAGQLTDSTGRTIDEISPVPILHNNVGLLGSSNGGNIVVAVAAQHGADLQDYLRYIIQWETPVCSQFATTNLGGVQIRCGTEAEYWRVVNPRYSAYGATEVTIDYSDLHYRPADRAHAIFHDGNGDNIYTETILPPTPCFTSDLDGDGLLSMDEDFPLSYYEDGTKQYYSRQATYAFLDLGLFLAWPSDIATPEEADAYWDLREAVHMYESAFNNIPALEGMVLGSVVDHVQTALDRPHLRQAFEWWDSRGKWVQFNPSPSYLVEVKPYMAARSDLPDNAPNTPPADWSDDSCCMPEGIADGIYQMAAVLQMADRAHDADGTAVLEWMAY